MYEPLHVVHFNDICCSNFPEVLEVLPASIEAAPDLVQEIFFNAFGLSRFRPSQCRVDDPADRGDTERDRDVAKCEDVDGTARRVIRPCRQRAVEGR